MVVNGYEYVKPSEVLAALRARGYEMVNAVDPKYMQIVTDDEIIVKDIPSDARGGKFYIPYDFYEANIPPPAPISPLSGLFCLFIFNQQFH